MQRFGKGGVRSDLLGLAYLQAESVLRCFEVTNQLVCRQPGHTCGLADLCDRPS